MIGGIERIFWKLYFNPAGHWAQVRSILQQFNHCTISVIALIVAISIIAFVKLFVIN